MTKPDQVSNPSHYILENGKRSIDLMRDLMGTAAFISFCQGNVLKYTIRYQHKNGTEDLKKAKVYAQWIIDVMEGNELTKK